MGYLISFLLSGILICLFFERQWAKQHRTKLKHVVYVNGTRGKTSVARLIDAGLRRGGYRVFCKTTGTVPLVIDVENREWPLKRYGKANIREQLKILKMAARNSAEILVCECMAITPELQRVSQDDMLNSDIGVITNVRMDHSEVMGDQLTEICDALSNTIPKNGMLFTADSVFFDQLSANAAKRGTATVLASSAEALIKDLPEISFEENVALAVAVCEHLGVSSANAIEGIKCVRQDPYTLKLYQLSNDVLFGNAFAANDSMSIQQIYASLEQRGYCRNRYRILLINNRWDRGARALEMVKMAVALKPDEIWLMGAYQSAVKRQLLKMRNPIPVKCIGRIEASLLTAMPPGAFVFAAGNIAGAGMVLMKMVESEGVAIDK